MLVHKANLQQKMAGKVKYADEKSRQLLTEIAERYEAWHRANVELIGPRLNEQPNDREIIQERVRLLNDYKDFIDQQIYAEQFDSRSNLHSSVIEEFLYYLFRDLVTDFGKLALMGKSHAFKDMFFVPPNYGEMISKPNVRIEVKDHDFIIGVRMRAELTCISSLGLEEAGENTTTEIHIFDIPAIVIECKTYLDKTMLEGSSAAAEQLKARNPNAIYIVVMEWIKLTDSVNVRKYKVDQIYVLRKQKNTDREYRFLPSYQKNPIYADVVSNLFERIRTHLISDWHGGVEFGLERGWLV